MLSKRESQGNETSPLGPLVLGKLVLPKKKLSSGGLPPWQWWHAKVLHQSVQDLQHVQLHGPCHCRMISIPASPNVAFLQLPWRTTVFWKSEFSFLSVITWQIGWLSGQIDVMFPHAARKEVHIQDTRSKAHVEEVAIWWTSAVANKPHRSKECWYQLNLVTGFKSPP